MDDNERASQLEEEHRRIALQGQAERSRTDPRDDCQDCDDPLPQYRREFGTCVYCQTIREQRGKHYRKD